MKAAILIDVENKQVRTVQIGKGITDIYAALKCDNFAVVDVASTVSCYVDDEGLLKEGYVDEDGTRHNLSGFTIGESEVLMGNGLLLGFDANTGESHSCPMTLDEVKKIVSFVEFDKQEDKPQPFMQFLSW